MVYGKWLKQLIMISAISFYLSVWILAIGTRSWPRYQCFDDGEVAEVHFDGLLWGWPFVIAYHLGYFHGWSFILRNDGEYITQVRMIGDEGLLPRELQ